LALPKSHPHADKPQIPLSLLKGEPFIGLNRMYPNYGDWLLESCRRVGFKPRIVKEADGAASALAFVAAGFGVAVISEPLQKIPATDLPGTLRRRIKVGGKAIITNSTLPRGTE
jgi:DNA-binding transcriptional LysR family regulator